MRGNAQEAVVTVVRSLGILGLLLPVGLAAEALERSARTATALRRERERIDTARLVASTVLADRLERSRHISTVVEPVLADLALLRPGEDPDGDLRRRCAIAGARMRGLLAEWYRGGSDPLGTELAACLDQLQTAGLYVDLAMHGDAPASGAGMLPTALVTLGRDVVLALAPHASNRMRVTILVIGAQVRLSVFIDTSGPPPGDLSLPSSDDLHDMTIRTTTSDDSLWVEMTCPLPPVLPTHSLETSTSSSSMTTLSSSPG
jgi:hypothetical protein